MEVLASNFESALKDFEEQIKGATYAAVDMELTGTDIDGMPDSYADLASERLAKMCQVAESYTPIQIGITLVKEKNNHFHFSSYNFYAFPYMGPELAGQDRSFLCRVSAMKFNADQNHVDFNKWLRDAVPYMSREDEAHYLASRHDGDSDLSRKVGLLRVWKLLCHYRVPLVTHCPLDIMFLMACFERRKLPRDPAEMTALILQCTSCVFDTAYLHGAIGGFKNLKLVEFLQDAKAKHAVDGTLPCHFDLARETADRYGKGGDLAHEAGFDSLCTAKLYAYLLSLAPERVGASVNRLFLYKSSEYLDLSPAAGEPDSTTLDFSRKSHMVARLGHQRDALRKISKAGFSYKRMDSSHALVSVPTLNGRAAMPAELLSIVGVQWLSFEAWRTEVRSGSSSISWEKHATASKVCTGIQAEPSSTCYEQAQSGVELYHRGVVKSFNAAKGYGFISCPATFAHFQQDVFVHGSRLRDPCIGQEVSFTIMTNKNGQPQVRDISVDHRGFLKSFNAAEGYGFISCPETFAHFQQDVFVHGSRLRDPCIGQELSFTIVTNSHGQPQVRDIKVTNSHRQPQVRDIKVADARSSRDGGDIESPLEADADEQTTTIGGSSDCASTSDLDSNIPEDNYTCRDVRSTLATMAWLGGAEPVHD